MTHQTEYQKIVFEAENSILEVFWTNTDLLDEESYKKEVLWQLDIVLQYCPKNILIDTRFFDFTITPEVQDWANTEVLPKVMTTGVRKIALLISKSLFAQVSIEQQMEDNPNALNLVAYFEDYESAKKWLLL
ncbi:MAG: hypothetical protein EAZ97_15640 [Bacteroidetes bacterium]|nr:MAG: hypothetical protein EAZ97_15640 [Bacteroidota bacterium]